MLFDEPGAVGVWVKLPTIESVQIMKQAGFDFVAIDQEHACIDERTAYQLISIASAERIAPLVRVDDLRPAAIQRSLDAGAAGVLIPRIDTVAQAEVAARSVRFPPVGSRGAGASGRAGRWGTAPLSDYLRFGNQEALCIPQLESAQALANAQQIAEVEGVDALLLGPADLALGMGLAPDDPRVFTLCQRALADVHRAKKRCGFAAAAGEAAAMALRAGFDFVLAGNDTGLLATAASATSATVHRLDGSRPEAGPAPAKVPSSTG